MKYFLSRYYYDIGDRFRLHRAFGGILVRQLKTISYLLTQFQKKQSLYVNRVYQFHTVMNNRMKTHSAERTHKSEHFLLLVQLSKDCNSNHIRCLEIWLCAASAEMCTHYFTKRSTILQCRTGRTTSCSLWALSLPPVPASCTQLNQKTPKIIMDFTCYPFL